MGRDNCGHHPEGESSPRRRSRFQRVQREASRDLLRNSGQKAMYEVRPCRQSGGCVQPLDAENRTSSGVGGCRSAISGTRPDRSLGNAPHLHCEVTSNSDCLWEHRGCCGRGPPAVVCPAGAEPIGVKGPRRGDDDNRSGSQGSAREGTPKGRKRTFDRRNTNWQRGREPRASRRPRAKPKSHRR